MMIWSANDFFGGSSRYEKSFQAYNSFVPSFYDLIIHYATVG